MHKLLTDDPGQKMLVLGNEAIVRGALEAGVAYATTYPGTPSSEIAENFFHITRETDLYFEYSTNEKVALEVAAAFATTGVRTMCSMKHVGVNVAADPLMTLAYVGVRGGLVVVSADDPFMFSSQNEQDNRYYGKLSGLPVLEPSSVEEAKELVKYAFDLSEQLQEPVIFRTTTRINHSSGVVELGKLKPRKTKGDFTKDPFSWVTVPAVSRTLHKRLLGRWEEARVLSNKSEWNRVEGSGPWGVICNGVSYNYAKDGAVDLGIAGKVKILRIGFSNPLPDELIKDFLKGCEKVLIIEEGEPVIEEGVKALAQEIGFTEPIRGKAPDLFSRLYEFDPATVRKNMAAFFGVDYTSKDALDTKDLPEIPGRPPNLCAGCPHRATYYAVRKVLGDDAIYPTDIGCYTLGVLPPLSMADYCICMGSSITTGCGFAKATGKKVVSFIGDSTFFHSGMTGLANAVHNNHNLTLVIVDNGTTAMTGHQPHPGVDTERMGLPKTRVSLENVIKGLGVENVTVVSPLKSKKLQQAVEDASRSEGVSVIISREPCPLFERGLGVKYDKVFYVNREKCKNHRDCITKLACPAFYLEDEKVCINEDSCIGCTLCAQVCPENAILPLKK
jgi:indolepyruvate ferredoxin oxidoreductase, alpha subunit